MIKITYCEIKKKAKIKLYNTDSFTEISRFLLSKYIGYDRKLYASYCTPLKALNYIPDLRDFDEVQISDHDMELLEKYKYGEKEVVKIRRKYNPDLLLHPPLALFQKNNIKKMINTNRFLLSDDVGLGKTMSTISTLNHLIEYGEVEKVIVVTLGSVVYNWKKEFMKFSDKFVDEDFYFLNTKNRDPFEEGFDKSKIIICTYDSFKLMVKKYGKKGAIKYRKPVVPFDKWCDPEKACIILDEAHYIKTSTSQRRIYLNIHKQYFNYRYLLTFTPFGNGIEDSFCLMNFLDESLVGKNYNDFVMSIAVADPNGGMNSIDHYKEKEVEAYRARISPYVARSYKKDVLPNLPKQKIHKIFIDMNREQLFIYQSIITRTLNKIVEEEGFLDTKKVFNKFPYLCLACSDPSLVEDKFEDFNLSKWKFTKNKKLEVLKELLKEHKKEKIIIWSYHPKTIDLLGEVFAKDNPIVLHGGHKQKGLTKDEYRENEIDRFKENPDLNLAILSPLILGTGKNIPESSVAIYWDRDFSVDHHIQSLGRNHRANSLKEVHSYILMFDKTLEIAQDKILERKVSLNDVALKNRTLTKEEWQDIFSGTAEI